MNGKRPPEGAPPAVAAQGLASFQNAKRRMEARGAVNGITVYEISPTTPRPSAPRWMGSGARWV